MTKYRVSLRLKKPLIHEFAFKPTHAQIYESLRDDIDQAPIRELDEFFEIKIEEVEDVD